MKQLKSSEIRDIILEEQEGICPLCTNEITGISLDRQHKLKNTDIGIDGG